MSVKSFHVPATPLTSAWPPNLPSVPTSRATRVTSDAKEFNWSTIVFTILAVRRNPPLTGWPSVSSGMDWDRSPFATAPITRVTSAVGFTRSPISELTDSTDVAHEPLMLPMSARSEILPSLPTTLLRRTSSLVSIWFCSMIAFKVEAISAAVPRPLCLMRAVKSPCLYALSVSRSPS